MSKYIIINTSPRPKGNCKAMVERIKLELEKTGAEVQFVDFRTSKIGYCMGCDACKRKDEVFCVQKDDMGALLTELDACDGAILLTPVYWGDVSAQTRTVVDRMYPFFNPAKEGASLATKTGKKFALIMSSGSMPEGSMDGAAKTITNGAFGVAGFTEARILLFNELNVPGSILQDEAKLARVDAIAAWMLV